MPSTGLSSDFKSAILRAATGLLTRRSAVREPLRIDTKSLEAITFSDAGDYQLMVDFRKRFPDQYGAASPLLFNYTMQVTPECSLKWNVQVTATQLTIRKQDKPQTLHRDRDPMVYDRLMEWLKLHEYLALETWLGEWIVEEALDHCGTTSQLNWLWPQLLKLDRSGKFQLLGETSRPKHKPQRSLWRDNWMSTISQWLAEGAVMGNLRQDQHAIVASVPLRGDGGAVWITRESVRTSIAANLLGLRVDAHGKRLPKFGDW